MLPSNDASLKVMTALRGPRDRFHSALAATIEQVKRSLDDERPSMGDAGAELGRFAEGRIALDRFTSLMTEQRSVGDSALELMQQSLNVLTDVALRESELCQLTVGPGENVQPLALARFSDVGRVFGATRVYELCRAHRYQESQHQRWLEALPHISWTAAERSIAPPLVITIDGADLRTGCLAEFLDGRQQLVLIVRGASPPAPLVGLITPRTFVAQIGNGDALDSVFSYDGPGVIAVLPEGTARFVHDPRRGKSTRERLTLGELPEETSRQAIGCWSVARQQASVRQLREFAYEGSTLAMAIPSAQESTPVASLAMHSPAEKLAAWLLDRANLSGLD